MLWFFIWVVFSTFILGVFFWSLQILLLQKKAWKTYAAKANLTYAPGDKLMTPPAISGKIKNFPVSLFTSQQSTPDIRGQRFSTIIEIALGAGMPDNGVAGTEKMKELTDTLDMPYTFVPQDKDWVNTWIVKTKNLPMMEQYMTQARVDAIKRIFKMKLLSALFIFDTQEGVLRIETADPMNKPEKLEKIMTGLVQQVAILSVTRQEYDALAAVAAETYAPAPVLPSDEPEQTPE